MTLATFRAFLAAMDLGREDRDDVWGAEPPARLVVPQWISVARTETT